MGWFGSLSPGTAQQPPAPQPEAMQPPAGGYRFGMPETTALLPSPSGQQQPTDPAPDPFDMPMRPGETPEQYRRRRQLARQVAQTQPVRSHGQGVALLATALVDGLTGRPTT